MRKTYDGRAESAPSQLQRPPLQREADHLLACLRAVSLTILELDLVS